MEGTPEVVAMAVAEAEAVAVAWKSQVAPWA